MTWILLSRFWTPTSKSALRLCLWLLLQGKRDELLAILAPVCSSWSMVNLFTSLRSELLPWGNCALVGVRRANKMISRCGCLRPTSFFWGPGRPEYTPLKPGKFPAVPATVLHLHWQLLVRLVLMMLLMCALRFSWILENPGSSCILLHPRLRWMIRTLKDLGLRVP